MGTRKPPRNEYARLRKVQCTSCVSWPAHCLPDLWSPARGGSSCSSWNRHVSRIPQVYLPFHIRGTHMESVQMGSAEIPRAYKDPMAPWAEKSKKINKLVFVHFPHWSHVDSWSPWPMPPSPSPPPHAPMGPLSPQSTWVHMAPLRKSTNNELSNLFNFSVFVFYFIFC